MASGSDPSPRLIWTVALRALGRIPDPPQAARGKVRLELDPHRMLHGDATLPPLVDPATLAEGDTVEFYARLEPLPYSTLPDTFDYGAFLESQDVRKTGRVDASTVRLLSPPRWWSFALLMRRFSGTLSRRLDEILSENPREAGLLKAMVFGRRETLSPDDREAFALSGTAHLLAISGLHVHLICFVVWRLLVLFGLSRRRAALFVAAATIAYCLLTGSSPAAVRATALVVTAAVGMALWRDPDPLSILGAAALFIFSYAPQELFNAGFQLSFLAVLSLCTLLPIFEEAWEAWRSARRQVPLQPRPALPPGSDPYSERIRNWIRSGLFVTLAATLATAPVVAWHMGRFATFSLLTNLLAIPLLSACMAAGSLVVFFGAFSLGLGKAAALLAVPLVKATEALLGWLASLPSASIDLPPPPVWLLLLYAAVLVALWIRESGRDTPEYRTIAGVCLALPLMLISTAVMRPSPRSFTVTVLDLLRGRATLIEMGSEIILLDCGSAGEGSRLAELLHRRGIRSLDALILSADEPEALDGTLELLKRVRVHKAIFPRCKFSSEMRRAIEQNLEQKHIDRDTASAMRPWISPGGLRCDFTDDGPAESQPAANGSHLAIRVSCESNSFLYLLPYSAASLGRLVPRLENNGMLASRIIRIVPSRLTGRWPAECFPLLARSSAEAVVGGTRTGAEELPGLDFDKLSARILSPHELGSIRLSPAAAGALEINAYRGKWRTITSD